MALAFSLEKKSALLGDVSLLTRLAAVFLVKTITAYSMVCLAHRIDGSGWINLKNTQPKLQHVLTAKRAPMKKLRTECGDILFEQLGNEQTVLLCYVLEAVFQQ